MTPVNASVGLERQGVNLASDITIRVIRNSQINQVDSEGESISYCSRRVGIPRFRIRSRSGTSTIQEFMENGGLSCRTPRTERALYRRSCDDGVACRIKDNPSHSDGYPAILDAGKNAYCKTSIFHCGFPGYFFRKSLLHESPVARDGLAPTIRDGINVGPINAHRDESSRFRGFIGTTPIGKPYLVFEAGSPSTGEYHATAECHDFAISVTWWWRGFGAGMYLTTVSSNYKYTLRVSEYKDGAGLDLGVCWIHDGDAYSNSKKDGPTHVILQSGKNSLAVSDLQSRKEMCYGCWLRITKDDKTWYDIIGLQEVPESSKRDLPNPPPSQE
ncbi:MAG TPA: hypothetical protein VFC29_03135 [Candidatus Limnocylindrales bacterium]|nr:hypothetical protein [Candidatus Limnocylindrales bacterium]